MVNVEATMSNFQKMAVMDKSFQLITLVPVDVKHVVKLLLEIILRSAFSPFLISNKVIERRGILSLQYF